MSQAVTVWQRPKRHARIAGITPPWGVVVIAGLFILLAIEFAGRFIPGGKAASGK